MTAQVSARASEALSDAPSDSMTIRTDRESAQPHILVVDDDARLRELIGKYLKEQGFLVTVAEHAAEARAKSRGIAFDLVVLDIMMPGESGLDLVKAWRQASDIPVLLLSARSGPDDRITGLEHGADDYLPKPFEPRELLLRIQTILRRTRPFTDDSNEVQIGEYRFNVDKGELLRGDEIVRLTSAEANLLKLFALNPGTVFSRTDLCERTEAGLERSVDVQINRLRRKVEVDPKEPLFLQTVRGVGYVLHLTQP